MPSLLEFHNLVYNKLSSDATLIALVGLASNISNHLPQDRSVNPGYIRFRIDSVLEWDTKTSNGFEGRYILDFWTEAHGDANILQMMDRVYELLHDTSFSGSVSQSLLVRYESSNTFIEPDGVTHHGVMNFRHILTD